MLCKMKDVKFTDPVVFVASIGDVGQNTAINEFESTESIKVECIHVDQFVRESSGDVKIDIFKYVSYIKAIGEVAKIDIDSNMYEKAIYFIDYIEEIREELTRQEIPYYIVSKTGSTEDRIIDKFNATTSEFKTEKFVNLDSNLCVYDFLVTGLLFVYRFGFGNPSYDSIYRFKKVLAKGVFRYGRFDHFIDSYGHIVLRTEDAISDKILYKMFRKAHIGKHDANRMACIAQCAIDDVVVLKHDDALAIIRILNKCLDESGKSDVEAFGNDAISYERLYDIVNHTLYPMIKNKNIISK